MNTEAVLTQPPRRLSVRQMVGCYIDTVELIRTRLNKRNETIAEAIKERALYFRVSLLGACNLACPFCHNEGAATKGKLEIAFAERAICIAHELGFRRIQFTGGEPLLHPRVADFVKIARAVMPDVGITTNGTYLAPKLASLISAGLSRIHVSLQAEALCSNPSAEQWSIPGWLRPNAATTRYPLSMRTFTSDTNEDGRAAP